MRGRPRESTAAASSARIPSGHEPTTHTPAATSRTGPPEGPTPWLTCYRRCGSIQVTCRIGELRSRSAAPGRSRRTRPARRRADGRPRNRMRAPRRSRHHPFPRGDPVLATDADYVAMADPEGNGVLLELSDGDLHPREGFGDGTQPLLNGWLVRIRAAIDQPGALDLAVISGASQVTGSRRTARMLRASSVLDKPGCAATATVVPRPGEPALQLVREYQVGRPGLAVGGGPGCTPAPRAGRCATCGRPAPVSPGPDPRRRRDSPSGRGHPGTARSTWQLRNRRSPSPHAPPFLSPLLDGDTPGSAARRR